MSLDKVHITRCFNQASLSYDQVAGVQKICAGLLTQLLKKTFPTLHPRSILDLGSGTGYVVDDLLRMFPKARYHLNDCAQNMLACTAEKFAHLPNVHFCLGDMEIMDFEYHDLIISNFSFQWIDDLTLLLTKLRRISQVLAFSCLLDGTFKEWTGMFEQLGLLSPVPVYPSYTALMKFLPSLYPTQHLCDRQSYHLPFENAQHFICYLRNIGAVTKNTGTSLQSIKKFIATHNHVFCVTYDVFFALLKR